jgi:hypothetical protein
MFSETLDLFKDLEDTISRLREMSERTEQELLRNTRNTLIDFVEQKGNEEYTPRRPDSEEELFDLAAGLARYFLNRGVDSKIRYVETLLSMIPDRNLSLFYDDLRLGLDNVIEKWDNSEKNPRYTNYSLPPQKVKNRYVFQVVRKP